MPVLYPYKKRPGHYALAGINGTIVTYRVTPEGVRRLADKGIQEREKFSWTVLLGLVSLGEASTGGTGGGDEDLSGWTQTGFLFDIPGDEPAANDLVPVCACGSVTDLHVTGTPEGEGTTGSLRCAVCRENDVVVPVFSIPLYLIPKTAQLARIITQEKVTPDDSLEGFRRLLDRQAREKWLQQSPRKSPRQESLLPQGSLF